MIRFNQTQPFNNFCVLYTSKYCGTKSGVPIFFARHPKFKTTFAWRPNVCQLRNKWKKLGRSGMGNVLRIRTKQCCQIWWFSTWTGELVIIFINCLINCYCFDNNFTTTRKVTNDTHATQGLGTPVLIKPHP